MGEVLSVGVPVATLWTAPDAPRAQDTTALGTRPDVAAWTAGMDTRVRLDLHGRTLTQLLLGEPVEVLEEAGSWVRVVAPWQPSSADGRGYPGWLPAAQLAEPPEPTGLEAVVTTSIAALTGRSGRPLAELSWATVLPVLHAGTRLTVALPGGARGYLSDDAADLRPAGATAYDPERLLAAGRQFVGMRYLWGGTCGWGLDCSGLVHLAFREQGLTVPRDAHDQQAAAQPVEVPQVRPGDLYFFRDPGQPVSHVGLVTGERRMLHATEAEDRVEDAPLAAERQATLCAAGRFPAGLP